ncbi:MAG: peptide deformylase [Holophagales bacterium]|nr:peptide deformylase [Holophagales bacterium]MYF95856.1 peptide deformylase [Holophagales bacterium]
MPVLPIRQYPDPVLRVRCVPVEDFGLDLKRLVEDMIQTMHDAPGVGLAAPQVGVELRVAVVDATAGMDPEAVRVLVNPEILDAAGVDTDTEGCLSIPDFTEQVTRPASVRVAARDLEGEAYEIDADELEARAIQHELDHLDGILFVDRLRGLRRQRARSFLRRLRSPEPAVAGGN